MRGAANGELLMRARAVNPWTKPRRPPAPAQSIGKDGSRLRPRRLNMVKRFMAEIEHDNYCVEEVVFARDYDIAADILRDIRPMLDGVRGEMPEGLGRRVMVALIARIDKALSDEEAL